MISSSLNLSQLDMIHHLHWQVDHNKVKKDRCILVQGQDCSDHPAFAHRCNHLLEVDNSWLEKKKKTKTQQIAGERERGIEVSLTPSTVKLPIIAHLVTTMFVSGNIAFSHAPSLLNSSVRPWIKEYKFRNFPRVEL